jgi:hypothetical protein
MIWEFPSRFKFQRQHCRQDLPSVRLQLLFWAVALVVVFEFARFGSGVPVVVVRLEMAARDPRFQAEQ